MERYEKIKTLNKDDMATLLILWVDTFLYKGVLPERSAVIDWLSGKWSECDD